jgi:peptidoglycan hydrolase-like protein with peptidoglycan-binding domain
MSVRDLELGMTGNDVLALQKLLNANGFPVAASGAGSASNETDYFGSLTKAALASYQAANGIAPAAGYFGTITRAQMKAAGVAGTWW